MAGPRPQVMPILCYRDLGAAVAWLRSALGFEVEMQFEAPEGGLRLAEMRFGDSVVMLSPESEAGQLSPPSLGGRSTQMLHVRLADGLDAHFERARAAGASILQAPADQYWGDRNYRCRDPEGHVWTFAQWLRPATAADIEAASGLKVTGLS
jgi:uncharacterized glyoxalase superfamily protein PhnB